MDDSKVNLIAAKVVDCQKLRAPTSKTYADDGSR